MSHAAHIGEGYSSKHRCVKDLPTAQHVVTKDQTPPPMSRAEDAHDYDIDVRCFQCTHNVLTIGVEALQRVSARWEPGSATLTKSVASATAAALTAEAAGIVLTLEGAVDDDDVIITAPSSIAPGAAPIDPADDACPPTLVPDEIAGSAVTTSPEFSTVARVTFAASVAALPWLIPALPRLEGTGDTVVAAHTWLAASAGGRDRLGPVGGDTTRECAALLAGLSPRDEWSCGRQSSHAHSASSVMTSAWYASGVSPARTHMHPSGTMQHSPPLPRARRCTGWLRG